MHVRMKPVTQEGHQLKSVVLGALLLLAGCTHGPHHRLIVLGVDGMDPRFVESHWSELPNLRRLCAQGTFSTLATTTPPQSPVASATFSTGLDPAEHGVFDFVHRDPDTLQPMSSFAETLPPAHQLPIGPYLLPLSRAQVRSFRKGRTFWEILADHGIPTTVIRMPGNYPPIAHAGEQLAGMGTPDLEGTFGTFTWYSDDPLDIARDVAGGRIVPVRAQQGRAILPIEGPPDTLRRDRARTHLDLIADIDGAAAAARFRARRSAVHPEARRMVGVDSRHFSLNGPRGRCARHVPHLCPAIAGRNSHLSLAAQYRSLRSGRCRSRSPLSYSRDLARAHRTVLHARHRRDTAALRQGIFSLPEYLAQSRMVQAEHQAMLRNALAHYRDGLLFFYFSEIDQNSHVLWGKHKPSCWKLTRAVGNSIDIVMTAAGNTTIIVMSDHGFAAFDNAFHLNTWLQRNGFANRAHAMGLNAPYVVDHSPAVITELVQRLQAEKPAIESVTRVAAQPFPVCARPDCRLRARISRIMGDGTGRNSAGSDRPNNDAWIGDHCIAAEAVPGILVTNRKARVADPRA